MSNSYFLTKKTYAIKFFGRFGQRSSFALRQLALFDSPLFLTRLDMNLQTVCAVLSTTDVASAGDWTCNFFLTWILEENIHFRSFCFLLNIKIITSKFSAHVGFWGFGVLGFWVRV